MSATAMPAHRPARVTARPRDIHEAHRVASPLELLFDLVFVVAISFASAQLHHGVVEGHPWPALRGFLAAFFGIWWAWMNYTWFASAYDSDDAAHRLLTMLQMFGAAVFAVGIPVLAHDGNSVVGVAGYAIMRLPMVAQWLRAARGDPPHRATCLRYAIGIAVVQCLWIARLGCSASMLWPSFVALLLLELAIPVWAERATGDGTPWHAHHIAERYGLLLIIGLGECVMGVTNAVAGSWGSHGWSLDIILVGSGGTLLIFSLWWMYFLLPSAEALHQHRQRAFYWGYGHYAVFATATAVGAGLGVVADTLAAVAPHAGTVGVSPVQAMSMVALAQGGYMLAIWALYLYAARPRDTQARMLPLYLGCVAAAPLAVALGVPLAWGPLLLSCGPLLAIAYNEHGRRHCAEFFSVR